MTSDEITARYMAFGMRCQETMKEAGFPYEADDPEAQEALNETVGTFREQYMFARVSGASDLEAREYVKGIVADAWKQLEPQIMESERNAIKRGEEKIAKMREYGAFDSRIDKLAVVVNKMKDDFRSRWPNETL